MTTSTHNLRQALANFFAKPIFHDYRTIAVLWLLFAIVATILKGGWDGEKMNNFNIFRQVYFHLIDLKSLYAYYPEEYYDHNLYGPVFSLIIAPFAIMPPFMGLLTWLIGLGALLYASILKMPLNKGAKIFIFWYISNEVWSAMQMGQFNIAIAALILGAYIALRDKKEWLAALCIVLGTLTKLYGIVGLVFLPFAARKGRFLLWTLVWSAILFALPMLISTPEYVVGQYAEWVTTILDKNSLNIAADAPNQFQNISALGMAHRIFGYGFGDLCILLPAMVIALLPFIRNRQYGAHGFQWGIVASMLMCVILFSTGSESSGYVIAMLGVAIWYLTAPWKRTKTDLVLLIFALVLGSFGTCDLVPRALQKALIRPYSLKALPVLIVWLKLSWELCTRNYEPEENLCSAGLSKSVQ